MVAPLHAWAFVHSTRHGAPAGHAMAAPLHSWAVEHCITQVPWSQASHPTGHCVDEGGGFTPQALASVVASPALPSVLASVAASPALPSGPPSVPPAPPVMVPPVPATPPVPAAPPVLPPLPLTPPLPLAPPLPDEAPVPPPLVPPAPPPIVLASSPVLSTEQATTSATVARTTDRFCTRGEYHADPTCRRRAACATPSRSGGDMAMRRILLGAVVSLVGLAGCGGDDSVGFQSTGGKGGTGGAVGGAGGSGAGGSGGSATGGASGSGGSVTGGAGGASGSGGSVTGGSGGATGGSGGSGTGGSGGTTGGSGGTTGGSGGTTGGSGGTTGGSGGTTGGAGGTTGGTGGTVTGGSGGTGGGCTSPAQCSDNDACTNDVCNAGVCSNPAIALSDNDACTLDVCDKTTGVAHLKEQTLFEEDFSDNSAGWVLGAEWQVKAAAATTGGMSGGNDPATDHTPSSDNGVAGVVVGGFPAKTVHGFQYLESPAIDVTKAPAGAFVELRFWRWLNADYTPYMRSRIEIWDGAQWVVVWNTLNQPSPVLLIDAPPRGMGWYPMSFDLTPYKNAQLKVRFGFDVGNVQVFDIGGWTVDDFAVVASAVKTDADQCTTMTCNPAGGAVFAQLPLADGDVCTIDTCTTPGGLSHVPKSRRFFEDFSDNAAGWNLGTQWAIGAAQSSSCGNSSCGGNDPGTDHTGTNDNGVAGVGIGSCTGTTAHGDYCLTSPNVNLTSEPGAVSLSYYRHLHSDQGPYQVDHVDVSSNGGSSWTSVWTSGNQCTNDGQWTLQTFDVTPHKSASFRVRFCYNAQANAYDVGGFSVDDVSLYDPVCIKP